MSAMSHKKTPPPHKLASPEDNEVDHENIVTDIPKLKSQSSELFVEETTTKERYTSSSPSELKVSRDDNVATEKKDYKFNDQACQTSDICADTQDPLSRYEPPVDKTCPRHESFMPAVASTPIQGGPDLCKNCSISMLSYISVVQDFLNNIARDVSKQIDPFAECLECVKENFPTVSINKPQYRRKIPVTEMTIPSSEQMQAREKRFYAEPYDATHEPYDNMHKPCGTNHEPSETTYQLRGTTYDPCETTPKPCGTSPKTCDTTTHEPCETTHEPHRTWNNEKSPSHPVNDCASSDKDATYIPCPNPQATKPSGFSKTPYEHYSPPIYNNNEERSPETHDRPSIHPITDMPTRKDVQNNSNTNFPTSQYSTSTFEDVTTELKHVLFDQTHEPSNQAHHNIPHGTENTFMSNDGIDVIMSMLYKLERHHSEDIGKGSSFWKKLEDLHDKVRVLPSTRVTDEAFVTFARNNADILGCLTLGASLLLCGTTRTICVLVSDGVHSDFVESLSSVFHEVLHIRSLDSVDTTKLSLLDQPELGITFGKLNVWRLKHFKKCVFLNPDTLVIQNCDELFQREELSAVPDIGWPDCFNSAVFVYEPSIITFWKLLEFADKQGSYDGGDQGLLNSYFNSWSKNLHQKLSFIYNLMANVSYTYTPAFKQFGRNVKIVQFMGPYKPWHVKFFTKSSQISPSSPVHPIYATFIHVWLNVFRVTVLPLLSKDIQRYVFSRDVVSAYELLRFFPSKIDSDVDYLMSPPSVRMSPLDPQQFPKPMMVEKLKLPPTQTYPSSTMLPPLTPDETFTMPSLQPHKNEDPSLSQSPRNFTTSNTDSDDNDDSSVKDIECSTVDEETTENPMPGYEMGDFQGMAAWEQGRMDYEGTASSDNIISRLHFLIDKPDRLV